MAPIFKKQPGFCQVCGKPIEGSHDYGQRMVCNTDCLLEAEWRATLYILGRDYYPDPRKKSDGAEK